VSIAGQKKIGGSDRINRIDRMKRGTEA